MKQIAGIDASPEVIEEAALACARKLAEWFGGAEEAIKALEDDPIAMVAIALQDRMDTMKKMAIKAHSNPTEFAMAVLPMVAAQAQAAAQVQRIL